MSCIVKKETSTSIVPPMENHHFKLWPMAAPRFRRKWIIIDLCLERFSKIRFGKFSRGSNFIFYFVAYKDDESWKSIRMQISISRARGPREPFLEVEKLSLHIFFAMSVSPFGKRGSGRKLSTRMLVGGWFLSFRFISNPSCTPVLYGCRTPTLLVPYAKFKIRARRNRKLITVIVIIDNRGIRRGREL